MRFRFSDDTGEGVNAQGHGRTEQVLSRPRMAVSVARAKTPNSRSEGSVQNIVPKILMIADEDDCLLLCYILITVMYAHPLLFVVYCYNAFLFIAIIWRTKCGDPRKFLHLYPIYALEFQRNPNRKEEYKNVSFSFCLILY